MHAAVSKLLTSIHMYMRARSMKAASWSGMEGGGCISNYTHRSMMLYSRDGLCIPRHGEANERSENITQLSGMP